MRKTAIRAAAGAALLTALSPTGGEAEEAQQAGSGSRYASIGREGDMVLLLDQQQGILYQCPVTYRGRCFERSRVGN